MAVDSTLPGLRDTHRERSRLAFVAYIDELAAAINPDLPTFETERWNRRLTEVLVDRGTDTAADFGRTVFALVGRASRFAIEPMEEWIDTVSGNFAENLNLSFETALFDAQLSDDTDAIDETVDRFRNVRTAVWAATVTGVFANFGAHEGAKASTAGQKTWQVNSGNPRDTHSALSGETVELNETFSNGMRWPGDPVGGPAEVANCQCSMTFV